MWRKYYLDIYCVLAVFAVVSWLSFIVIWGINL